MSGNYTHPGIGGPGDASDDYNAQERHIKSILSLIPGSAMVQIVKAPYDANGNPIQPGTVGPIGFVDVLPSINQLDGNDNPVPHGTVYGLPYARVQGGKNAIIHDPALYDLGVAVFPSRDGSAMRKANPAGATKQVSANPGSRRRNSWSDGIYLHSWSVATPTQYITFLADGIKWHDVDGNEIVTGTAGMALTTAVGNLRAVVTNGTATITASGKVTVHSDTGIDLTAPVNTIKANGTVIG